jgi:hypothetical protein
VTDLKLDGQFQKAPTVTVTLSVTTVLRLRSRRSRMPARREQESARPALFDAGSLND